MTILVGILIYVGLVVLALTFFRFVHRSDEVLHAIHADLEAHTGKLGSPIAHNRVA